MQRFRLKDVNYTWPVFGILFVFLILFLALLNTTHVPWGMWAFVATAPPVLVFWVVANAYVEYDGASATAGIPFMLFFRAKAPFDKVPLLVERKRLEDEAKAEAEAKAKAEAEAVEAEQAE